MKKILNENEWIDVNLKMVSESDGNRLDFLNRQNKSASFPDQEKIIEKLRELNLADCDKMEGHLTDFGEKVMTLGGWIKFKELELQQKLEEQNMSDKLRDLQVENIEYQKTLRDRNEKITKLELKLKRFELFQKWWWLIGILIFILGFVLSNLITH